VVQFGQYALASWVGILVQFVFTNLLVTRFHYLMANAIAIVIASVFNYLANDFWTFGRLRLWLQGRT
jgi:dolichol-phosphate mannosyltransferase